jgi:2-haloacid dehalogenase
MAIKNIVFDFGGVLIDWNPRYFYKDVFRDKSEMEFFLSNICSSEWIQKQDAGYPFSEATKELQNQFPKYKNEIEMYHTNWKIMLRGEIIENTKLLKPLKTKYRLFGLTNWSAEEFFIVFERYLFFKNFEGIVVSGQEKMVKPNRDIYELLLNRYELQAVESLFIDDNLNNVKTAKELGFFTIHVNGNQSLEEHLIKSGLLNYSGGSYFR